MTVDELRENYDTITTKRDGRVVGMQWNHHKGTIRAFEGKFGWTVLSKLPVIGLHLCRDGVWHFCPEMNNDNFWHDTLDEALIALADAWPRELENNNVR